MKTQWSSFILSSSGLVLMMASGAVGEAKRPMTLVDLLEVPVLNEPRLSPSGDEVVFVLAEANWEENKRIRHIWLSKTDGSVHIQLTNGTEGESRPRWSPDGSGVAFIAKRGNDEEKQIYVIDPHGGEAERVTEHETAVSMIEWAPDGASLYFLAADAKTEEEKTREEKVGLRGFVWVENCISG